MLKFAVLCALLGCISGLYQYKLYPSALEGSRIVNGIKARLGEIPYIVSVRINRQHNCGGTILDKKHVLTAAHCIIGVDPNTLRVQYGELNIWSLNNIIRVANAYSHEEYSPGKNYINDIAVLKLAEDLVYTKYVQPVRLPLQDEILPGGNTAVLSGWGLNASGGSIQNYLQRVDVILYTDKDCKADHGSNVDLRYHVCTGVPEGGKGVCNGDSGGPLISNEKQWGIASWSRRPCAFSGAAVFARVPTYINWIKAKLLL